MDITQPTWFNVPAPESEPVKRRHRHATDPNPMIAVYGAGPVGTHCGTCRWLERWAYAKTYRKCRKRGVSHSEATDHFATWPACGRYEREED